MRQLIAPLLSLFLAALALSAVAQPVVVDGHTGEWRDARNAMLLEDDLVLRLQANDEVSLHAIGQPLLIELDLDADPQTGDDGVDARITFSPERSRDGVRIHTIDATGFASPRTTLDADLAISPSFAARTFEVRINPRRLARLAEVAYDRHLTGTVQSESVFPAFNFNARAVAPDPAATPTQTPARPARGLRVATFNVERGAPMTDPEPFARLMHAIDADVYLLQEWDDVLPDQLTGWFNHHVGQDRWTARIGPEGVAIVSRLPILTSAAPLDETRYVQATLDTPLGPVTVASMHFKCCGSPGSPEDALRIEQAGRINNVLRQLHPEQRRRMVVGGDLNLVGTRKPLLQLIDRLGLQPVDTPVLGDIARYTWRHPAHPFAQGRLDYLTLTDSTLSAVNAFAIDTLRLPELPASLERSTSSASDHLPLVLDLAPRR